MDDQLDVVFGALADPTRRAILTRLAGGEATVTELAAPFAMSMPAVSKHLKVLERAGLITRGREAQWRPCRLEARPLGGATEWLERYRQFWEQAFDRLALSRPVEKAVPSAGAHVRLPSRPTLALRRRGTRSNPLARAWFPPRGVEDSEAYALPPR